MRAWGAIGAAVLAFGAAAQERPIPPDRLQSGVAFLAPDQRSLQQDEFANPGMLWVERGERLWREPAGAGGRACAACHGDARASMKGAAARHPVWDPKAGRLFNLEDRINQCRAAHQGAAPFAVRVRVAALAHRLRRASVPRAAGRGFDRRRGAQALRRRRASSTASAAGS